MTRVYRISWIEKQHLLESVRHTKQDTDNLCQEIIKKGCKPLVTWLDTKGRKIEEHY